MTFEAWPELSQPYDEDVRLGYFYSVAPQGTTYRQIDHFQG